MLGPVLAHAYLSGRLVCLRCQPCMVALGLRYVSHYETLGVGKTASQAEIRSAFLSRSKQLHPDVNRQDPKNHEKFVKLNEAYTVLSKPLTRREYDISLSSRVLRDRQTRSASSSHTYGSSPFPGSNYGRQYEEQEFWYDETVFHARDQSRQSHEGQSYYYGFTKMKRVPNSYILMVCIGFMTMGTLLFWWALRKSAALHRSVLDERDKKLYASLEKARNRARINGNDLQAELLMARVNEAKLKRERAANKHTLGIHRRDESS